MQTRGGVEEPELEPVALGGGCGAAPSEGEAHRGADGPTTERTGEMRGRAGGGRGRRRQVQSVAARGSKGAQGIRASSGASGWWRQASKRRRRGRPGEGLARGSCSPEGSHGGSARIGEEREVR